MQTARQMVNHPELGALTYSLATIREDADGQVEDTIAMMRQYVLEDYRSDEIGQDAAEAAAAGANPITGVWMYVKSRLRFVTDEHTASPFNNPNIVEVFIRPRDMHSLGMAAQGDCDDYVMYAAALLMRLGWDARFVAVAADPRDWNRYSHVYLAAYRHGERVAMDISHGDYPGWEVPDDKIARKREWPIQTSPLSLVVMIGAIYAIARYAS